MEPRVIKNKDTWFRAKKSCPLISLPAILIVLLFASGVLAPECFAELGKRPFYSSIGSTEIHRLSFFLGNSLSEEVKLGRDHTFVSEEKTFSNLREERFCHPSPDWKGIGGDTKRIIGYQIAGVGLLYLLPEGITKWTDEQRRATASKWAKNAGNPTWDNDLWWINYVGHPYLGAAYYIRARERGLGVLASFCYSALLSAMFEFGAEASFEQPSYQDLIVTPVGGMLIGKFIFEPIRGNIKSKKELMWSDHLLLVLTDPLGSLNGVVDRVFGIDSNIRLTRSPTSLLVSQSFEPPNTRYNRSRQGFGVVLVLRW